MAMAPGTTWLRRKRKALQGEGAAHRPYSRMSRRQWWGQAGIRGGSSEVPGAPRARRGEKGMTAMGGCPGGWPARNDVASSLALSRGTPSHPHTAAGVGSGSPALSLALAHAEILIFLPANGSGALPLPRGHKDSERESPPLQGRGGLQGAPGPLRPPPRLPGPALRAAWRPGGPSPRAGLGQRQSCRVTIFSSKQSGLVSSTHGQGA